jgi:hypothetical protein
LGEVHFKPFNCFFKSDFDHITLNLEFPFAIELAIPNKRGHQAQRCFFFVFCPKKQKSIGFVKNHM